MWPCQRKGRWLGQARVRAMDRRTRLAARQQGRWGSPQARAGAPAQLVQARALQRARREQALGWAGARLVLVRPGRRAQLGRRVPGRRCRMRSGTECCFSWWGRGGVGGRWVAGQASSARLFTRTCRPHTSTRPTWCSWRSRRHRRCRRRGSAQVGWVGRSGHEVQQESRPIIPPA